MKQIQLLIILLFMVFTTNAQNIGDSQSNVHDRMTLDFAWENYIDAPSEVESAHWRNRFVQLNFTQPFFKKPDGFNLASGLSLSFSNIHSNVYAWDFDEDGNLLAGAIIDDSVKYNRNKTALAYLDIPLELQYASSETSKNAFRFTLGLRAGLLIDGKTKFKDDEQTIKIKNRDYYNTFKYGAYFRVGYNRVSLFGQYIHSPVFSNDAPDVRHFAAGFTFHLF